jgi:hypothetical protein
MLIAMLVVWGAQGKPHYPSMSEGQTVAYISDVGAQGLKPLFIAGSCVMAVFLDLSFASERWLRHMGRLAKNRTVMEKVLTTLSLICAVAGTVGLICLTIFDTLRHSRLHHIFLIVFIVGYVLSAIFICWEYQRLGISKMCPWGYLLVWIILITSRLPRASYSPCIFLDQTIFHHRRSSISNRYESFSTAIEELSLTNAQHLVSLIQMTTSTLLRSSNGLLHSSSHSMPFPSSST